MIDDIIAGAPLLTRVVVVGVCMVPDRIRPAMAINKEIDLRFMVGYTPLEFRDTLHMLADGEVNAARMITGPVGPAESTARSPPRRSGATCDGPDRSLERRAGGPVSARPWR